MRYLVPGTLFLIDTSAAARAPFHQNIRETIENLVDDGIAATCVTLDLEALYSVRDAKDVVTVASERQEYFVNLATTEEIGQRAREVQTLMAQRGMHRAAGPVDLLIAAVAEQYRATILHYDADFEHIASVTGQQHQWIVPRGSVD